jgi:tetratricopeptide (TPR) repeat protein
MTYHSLGHLEEAIKSYKRFIQIIRSRVGEETPELANAYRDVAEIYQEQCELSLAMTFYKKALHVQKVIMGKLHPDVGSTLNRLGNVCYSLKDYKASPVLPTGSGRRKEEPRLEAP